MLYCHRDDEEAAGFLGRLMEKVQVPENGCILDLACGRGRHTRQLSAMGYHVTGIDLSPSNIQYCTSRQPQGTEYYVHDMRKNFRINYFDMVLNMFTSFAYFDDPRENLAVLRAASDNLKPGGILVIDFFNAHWANKELPCTQDVQEKGIDFHITKEKEGAFFVKSITFNAEGKDHLYREKVRALTLDDFHTLFSMTDLTIRATYGDYDLNPFDKDKSERLILVAGKP
ncbi:MAG: class I SAM-dependent methyltransferase [Flavobacteriales bacterium]|nr:class I SAM-dependent methyltransferase [Flavobacteriales bacterium]